MIKSSDKLNFISTKPLKDGFAFGSFLAMLFFAGRANASTNLVDL